MVMFIIFWSFGTVATTCSFMVDLSSARHGRSDFVDRSNGRHRIKWRSIRPFHQSSNNTQRTLPIPLTMILYPFGGMLGILYSIIFEAYWSCFLLVGCTLHICHWFNWRCQRQMLIFIVNEKWSKSVQIKRKYWWKEMKDACWTNSYQPSVGRLIPDLVGWWR